MNYFILSVCVYVCMRITVTNGFIFLGGTQTSTEKSVRLKDSVDFIEDAGYRAETHEVTTEDGYILEIHRIPGRLNEPHTSKPVAVIQHGFIASSDNWLLPGHKSLPIYLASRGFDVWLPNNRGNRYSNKHVNMTSGSIQYWQYSLHEIGYYDTAASIDHILKHTRQPKLFFIAHSRGCTAGMILLSERPEYNEKIELFVALAPVIYTKHFGGIQGAVLKEVPVTQIARIAKMIQLNALPTKINGMGDINLRVNLCGTGAPLSFICIQILMAMAGFNYELFDKSLMTAIMSHYPDGGSLQEANHYLQIGQSDMFRRYDYGTTENVKKYGTREPPIYNLGEVTAKVAIYYSDNDFFVNTQDLKRLVKELPNVVLTYRIPLKKFNHLDYLWGKGADTLLYKNVAEEMIKYMHP